MRATTEVFIVSDLHYASAAERARGFTEFQIISNPLLRLFVRAYRHFFWCRNQFSHNHLLDRFITAAADADVVVANGDYSCDTAFVGVSDAAAFESAQQCLTRLRERFGPRLNVTMGDHELGKTSIFGGRGGMRLASWDRVQNDLMIQPCWQRELGAYVLLGVASSVIALPAFERDTLPEERTRWQEIRREHLLSIEQALAKLSPNQKLILFCHDPTALPYLWREPTIQSRLAQIEATIIGHLHSPLILWKSRLLAGMPPLSFLGYSIHRMSAALRKARTWRHFNVRLCPAVAGIELLKDGGFAQLTLDESGQKPLRFEVRQFRSLS